MIEKTADALRKRKFTVQCFATAEDAKKAVMEDIGGDDVGFGGSVTTHGMGLYEALRARGNHVFSHTVTPVSEDPDIYKKEAGAAAYIASANAILTDGRIVNIDGRGNRVAQLAFGPRRAFIVAGRNKIVEGSLDDAIARVKKDASGKNARRLGYKTPCALHDICADCDSPDRICKVITITEGVPHGMDEFLIYLVDEDLGY